MDILSDPAMRALVAAVLVSEAPKDLRVPCVAAAYAVDGPLSIVPAVIAASGRVDDKDKRRTIWLAATAVVLLGAVRALTKTDEEDR